MPRRRVVGRDDRRFEALTEYSETGGKAPEIRLSWIRPPRIKREFLER